ncbi:hypothetical protein HN018_27965 (plasmid) [Lichenicola cladoniae]|uniref:Uncharacterized protein n=1 Tax=Lichenicola cladoniae TaxID=1484109 RepID=A0A6M8I275_9PROT|nr:hypothetical protein [Lichenicola cladoniae]NPD69664.1 hypothetical protein [Acetobacteraceae bacterium]QKE93961.1 hypothetical protein HN018_27965 [Lichenicola cladoniae]
MKITLPVAAICTTLSATAIAAPKTVTSTLSCGPATVTATSTTDPHVPPNDDFAWLAQKIMLSGTPAHKSVSLQVDPKAGMIAIGRQKALAAAVVSWACLTSTQGKTYVLLDVSCMRENDDGVCHGQKEWVRIVGTDGSHPDTAYAPQDPRYDALYKRLGISVDNVQLTGIF